MNDQVAVLAERGLALSQGDSARLVEILLASLDPEPQSEVEAAWEIEIESRLAAYDRGEVQAIDAEEVFVKVELIAR